MYLGLDIGTQSLKAVIADERLQVVGLGSTPLQYNVKSAVAVEQNANDWLASLKPAIAQALASAGCEATAVRALGVGGQLDGCVPVDSHGNPLHPCLIWMDRRADALIRRIPADLILERCGIVRDAIHMAAKITWFEQKRPEIAAATRVYHQPVTFLLAQLTSQSMIDRALASTTMLYDITQQRFAEDLCVTFHINSAKLPALAGMSDLAGLLNENGAALTGLPVGLPVAVGTGDDFTNAIGAGLLKPGAMLCQIGTAEVIGALHHSAVIDERALVQTYAFMDGTYLIGNPGWLSGGAIEWVIRLLSLKNVGELNRLASEAPAGSGGVIFIPALNGAMAPEWNADMRACFHGLSLAHDGRHLARAVMEGTAFAMRDVQERLIALGVQFDIIVLAGGGAVSDLWAQIRADVSGLPVHVSAIVDASALGAAVLGAVASKSIPSIAAAAPFLSDFRKRVAPNSDLQRIYDKSYRTYQSLYAALKPVTSS